MNDTNAPTTTRARARGANPVHAADPTLDLDLQSPSCRSAFDALFEEIVETDHTEPVTQNLPTSTVNGLPHQRGRRSLALAAAATALVFVALAAMVTSRSSGDEVWAAEAIRVAEGSPRVLPTEPNWTVESVQQFDPDNGELQLANGSETLGIFWQDFETQRDQALRADRLSSAEDSFTVTALGGTADAYQYATDEYRVVLTIQDHTMEFVVGVDSPERLDTVVGSLEPESVDSWLGALPDSVTQPSPQPELARELLAGVPLPPALDVERLGTGTVGSEAAFVGLVQRELLCGWLDVYFDAAESGDDAIIAQVRDVLAESDEWPVTQRLAEVGEPAYVDYLTQVVRAVVTGEPITTGSEPKPLTRDNAPSCG